MRDFALEGAFWRKMARWGARGPRWFAQHAPPVVGVAVCAFFPEFRRVIAANLRMVKGPRGALQETLDVARVFATYAACVSEVLEGDDDTHPIEVTVEGGEHVETARAGGRGVVLVTAHTAGWEAVGHAFRRNRGLPILVATAMERDPEARSIQEQARQAQGLLLTHVGDDALSALPLLAHLRKGGVAALQIDRAPATAQSRNVQIFGQSFRLPEGPLRLASLAGTPIVPVFAHRAGYRRYVVSVCRPVQVPRRAEDADMDTAAQTIANTLQDFLRKHPTQWFPFRPH